MDAFIPTWVKLSSSAEFHLVTSPDTGLACSSHFLISNTSTVNCQDTFNQIKPVPSFTKPPPVGLRPAEGVGEVVGGAALVVGHRHGAVPLVVPGHEFRAQML